RLLRASERDEKCVPLGIHLMAALPRDGRADQPPVLGQDLRVALPQRLDQPRRSLDIAEQEGDRPLRQPAHLAAPPSAASTHPPDQHRGVTAAMPAPAAPREAALPRDSPSARAARPATPAAPSCMPGTTIAPPAASHLQA